MKCHIPGKQPITLTQHNFIAKGGEGEIYGKDNLIYKINLPTIPPIKLSKINELKRINTNNVLTPIDIILDQKDKQIGHTMKWIRNTYPLCKLFTNSFRNNHSITSDIINNLILSIKDTIYKIHESDCLIVDGNEFNYLVDDKFTTPYFIDVDSYQTKSFPATAIMPSIVDYHSKTFTKLSDWYSFAIVICQLFVGIHPFKGSHPNYKKRDLKQRMIDNVSIFNPKTSLPPSVRDLSVIPHNWLLWFIDVFEKGLRIPPPSDMSILVATATKKVIIKSSQDLYIKLLKEYNDNIIHYSFNGFNEIVKTTKEFQINNKNTYIENDYECITSLTTLNNFFVKIENNFLHVKSIDKNTPSITYFKRTNIQATDMMIVDNTLYVINDGKLSNIVFKESKTDFIVGINKTWDIMKYSSVVFQNIIYQNILGSPFLMIPFNSKECVNVSVPELKDMKIVGIKYLKNICIGIGFKNNKYYRFKLLFQTNEKYVYDEQITDTLDINFIVLENGIAISIIEDGKLEMFTTNSNKRKIVKNKNIYMDMTLCHYGMDVKFFKDSSLYSIKIR